MSKVKVDIILTSKRSSKSDQDVARFVIIRSSTDTSMFDKNIVKLRSRLKTGSSIKKEHDFQRILKKLANLSGPLS